MTDKQEGEDEQDQDPASNKRIPQTTTLIE
jgi:hypothetical protein